MSSCVELASHVLPQLLQLRDECQEGVTTMKKKFSLPSNLPLSAINVIHCLVMHANLTHRRELAQALKRLCIDIGSHETHCLAALDVAIEVVSRVAGVPVPTRTEAAPAMSTVTREQGRQLLIDNTSKCFGDRSHAARYAAIMVTLDPTAGTLELLQGLLTSGMDVIRLNTAHDGPEQWDALLRRLEAAEHRLQLPAYGTRLYVDLAGPKLRTLPIIVEGVRKYKPLRDERGEILRRATVTLGVAPVTDVNVLPIEDASFLEKAAVGDTVRFKDMRGKKRSGVIIEASKTTVTCAFHDTCYVNSGIKLRLKRSKKKLARTQVASILEAAAVPLNVGDQLILATAANSSGSVDQRRVPVDLGGALVKVGERVLLDDGLVVARITEVSTDGNVVCRVEIAPAGFKLKAEKGVNLPDSNFPNDVCALTDDDMVNLKHFLTVGGKRPLTIGLSFVRSETDVGALHRALRDLSAGGDISICIKIETRAALACLPLILIAALSGPPASIMIARGDLAAEIGFSDLSSAMDDIVVLAAASHLPVVFATQVLEKLCTTGTPSRAEVSDCVVGSKCECVMLNKGAHVIEATAFLSSLLEKQLLRMHKHRLMLRSLANIDIARFIEHK